MAKLICPYCKKDALIKYPKFDAEGFFVSGIVCFHCVSCRDYYEEIKSKDLFAAYWDIWTS